MFEYQIVVSKDNVVLFKTEWRVGVEQTRNASWLLAIRFGDEYTIEIRERREPFVSTPWAEFTMSAPVQ